MALQLVLRYILLLFLEVSPWEQGVWRVEWRMPCPGARVIGNAAEHPVPGRLSAWLFVLRTLGSGRSCPDLWTLARPLLVFSALIHVLFWLFRRLGFMGAAWRQPGLSDHALAHGQDLSISIRFQKQQWDRHLSWK